jgi:hypothetical protein
VSPANVAVLCLSFSSAERHCGEVRSGRGRSAWWTASDIPVIRLCSPFLSLELGPETWGLFGSEPVMRCGGALIPILPVAIGLKPHSSPPIPIPLSSLLPLCAHLLEWRRDVDGRDGRGGRR